MSTNPGPVVVEQTFDAPFAAVWRAITDQDEMRQWFFEPMTKFVPEIGFETEFNVHYEGTDYLHQWKVTEVIPEKRITYDWRYGGYTGHSSVAWELSETTDGTKLTLTHTGGETFAEDEPAFTRERCQAGWEYFLHESLKAFLERDGAQL